MGKNDLVTNGKPKAKKMTPLNEKMHRWELDGAGKAPFKVVGIFEMPSKSLLEYNPAAYNNQMAMMPRNCACGSCAVCGSPLTINYIIKDANGKLFPVGCECVRKHGSASLIEKTKALKLKRDREIREQKRLARWESNLQAQREKNGGLTNYELYQEKQAAAKKRELERIRPIIETLAPLADAIDDGLNGTFRCSIACDLREGKIPKGRGMAITIGILAKMAGRKNSKAYQAEYDRIESIFNGLAEN